MTKNTHPGAGATSRRAVLKGAAALGVVSAASAFPAPFVRAQGAPVKIGFMLPYTGTYAKLGKFIDDAFRLHVAQNDGKLGGRPVEYVTLDSEAKPPKAPENMNRLVTRDAVDFVVGPVHSGVAMGMLKVARDNDSMLIIPNAGVNQATGPLCAPNVFRSSFSNWQPAYPMGQVMYDAGVRKAVAMSWKYGAGEQSIGGFRDGFEAAGGEVVEEIYVPFPEVEFQAHLTRLAELKPDALYVFFAGGGAVKFVKDYAAAGLRKSIPLYGAGFLTDGVLPAQGEAAEGLLTTLHYGDGLDIPANNAFRAAFKEATGAEADVYAVQGYDAAQMIGAGMAAVDGDTAARAELVAAIEGATIDSPRGPFTLSAAHNPVQNFYLREAKNGQNVILRTAHEALADPARGCKMGA